jgi:hypothetical protein
VVKKSFYVKEGVLQGIIAFLLILNPIEIVPISILLVLHFFVSVLQGVKFTGDMGFDDRIRKGIN